MNKRQLGISDLHITSLGFGSWAVGGPWQFGWSNQDDSDSIAAIHRALELGVNWIDTAAVYGLGHSEEVVAKALADWKGERPYIFTKCGMVWDDRKKVDYCLKAESIRQECENSLRRLKADVIDLYQMHWPADNLDETLEGWQAMLRLKEEGKVRWIGASNFSREELEKTAAITPQASLQPPYSLIKREIEEDVLPFCREHNVGVIVYSPMASGLLTGRMTKERAASLPDDDWRRKNTEFKEPKLSQNLEIVERLRKVGEKHGRSPGEIALAWTLRDPVVTGAIVGARSADQVDGVFKAGEIKLSADDVAAIEGDPNKAKA